MRKIKVDAVQARSFLTREMRGCVSRVAAVVFRGGDREVTLAHLNPPPWRTHLEERNLQAAECSRVDGGALGRITLRRLSSHIDFYCAVFSRKHQRSEGR